MNLYFAYGSNLSMKQMAKRCPAAKPLGSATLDGYRLDYRVNSGGRAVATIVKDEGSWVEGAIWRLTKACEETLDRCEGAPYIYYREKLKVKTFGGSELECLSYIMHDKFEYGIPAKDYFSRIWDGYSDFGLDTDILLDSLEEATAKFR